MLLSKGFSARCLFAVVMLTSTPSLAGGMGAGGMGHGARNGGWEVGFKSSKYQNYSSIQIIKSAVPGSFPGWNASPMMGAQCAQRRCRVDSDCGSDCDCAHGSLCGPK
jgi:hypothetical protein